MFKPYYLEQSTTNAGENGFLINIQHVAWSLAVGLLFFVLYEIIAPFGLTKAYKTGVGSEISKLGPKERVLSVQVEGVVIEKIIDDLVYFSTDVSYQFDIATVKITYKNPYDDQDLYIGFQDQEKWHYATQLFDAPILNGLGWEKIGSSQTLYQKTKKYNTIEEFYNNPPNDAIVGIYNVDRDPLTASMTLHDYLPAGQDTIIDIPLRGKHVLFAYVKDEPFRMTIVKQDLNWYEGEDYLITKIYKGKDIVYETVIEDDGILNASRKNLAPVEVTIQNPGPGLPEAGVYKIVLDASSDVVIKSIRTNLHKIIFQGPVFPISNSNIYGQVIPQTLPTVLFTGAIAVEVLTKHSSALGDIEVNEAKLPLIQPDVPVATQVAMPLSKVVAPKSDVYITGILGYFAQKPDQLFKPTPFLTLPIQKWQDLELVDFVLADYEKSQTIGDWSIATKTFNLKNASIKNGKLSWILKAPKIRENQREIPIKSIEVTYEKKPII